MQNNGIQAHHIVKDFQTGDAVIRVLHGIDMNIEPGKLTLLVGPSGCGKTTFISIVSGILTPTEGTIVINGKDISHFSDDEKVFFRRQHIGFIFQQYNLLLSLTAAENTAIPLVARGIPLAQAIEKAYAILSDIGMSNSLHKLPNQLSGGQQQRVAIARALVHDPDIIICDEPTSALDAHTGHTVMEILYRHALQAERVVLVVTHDNRIFHFADRIIHLNDGRIEKDEIQQGSLT